jgi:hypothetical protein
MDVRDWLFNDVYDKHYPSESVRMKRADAYKLADFDRDSDQTQCDYLLDYLSCYRNITALEALRGFDCFRLAARVSDLKKRGYVIKTEKYTNARKKTYAIYRLIEDEEAELELNWLRREMKKRKA